MKAKAACRSCGRVVAIVGSAFAGAFPSLAAHRCPHGECCARGGSSPSCQLCRVAADAKPEVLAPACLWCSPDVTAQAKGKGCARCRWSGERAPEPGAMAEIRAGVVDVWGTQ